ncbi:MAG: hypothetical protein ACTSPY_02465 [Candidatus Helarchaeota archaeon]
MNKISEIYDIEEAFNYFIYDLYIPMNKVALSVIKASYSPKSRMIVIKNGKKILGHVYCFHNERSNSLEFGFFGQLDPIDNTITKSLLNKIEETAKSLSVNKIIGPVNAPPGIFLYGFEVNDEKQKNYYNIFLDNGYSNECIYRIYEIPILPKRNLVKPHGLIHVESIEGIDRNKLKKELHEASQKIIGAVSDELFVPQELWDAVFYMVDNYGYPECIQMTYGEDNKINGTAIMIPNSNPEYLVNNGRSNELRIASGGWEQSQTGKGYAMYHLYKFGNMCKKNKVKHLLIGQTDIQNKRALRAFEKFGCPMKFEHAVLNKIL